MQLWGIVGMYVPFGGMRHIGVVDSLDGYGRVVDSNGSVFCDGHMICRVSNERMPLHPWWIGSQAVVLGLRRRGCR